jgi:hypothetical protein
MYAQVGSGLALVGVAYSERIGHNDPAPQRFAGHDAPWHLHQSCFAVPGEGTTLADGVDDCLQRGGRPTPRQIAMVHVWSGEGSPDGLFAHDNPALPYVAVGLTPPTTAVWADHHEGPAARALALALGETYDARMGYARRVEALAAPGPLHDSLALHRSRIADQVKVLQTAQAGGDRDAWSGAAGRAIAAWEALRSVYRRMAPTSEIRTQLDRQYDEALGRHHHD